MKYPGNLDVRAGSALKFLPVIPIITGTIASILIIVALHAGTKPDNNLEKYNVINFNLSGVHVLGTPAANICGRQVDLGGIVNSFTSVATGVASAVTSGASVAASGAASVATAAASGLKSACNAAASGAVSEVNNVVKEILDGVGIKEYYAVHLTTICEGSFTPNAAAQNASVNVEKCFGGGDHDFDLSNVLAGEIAVGPLKLGLKDLGISDDVVKALKLVPEALHLIKTVFITVVIVVLLPVGLTGIALACALFLKKRQFDFALWCSSSIAAIVAFGIVTFGAAELTSKTSSLVADINAKAKPVGIIASQGSALIALMWAAAALMLITLLAIAFITFKAWRNKKHAQMGHWSDKNASQEYNQQHYVPDGGYAPQTQPYAHNQGHYGPAQY